MTPSFTRPDPASDAPLFAPARQRTGALMSLLQLHWFIRLRWAFVGAALAVLAIERFASPKAIRPGTLAIPVLLLAIVNLVWMGLENFLVRRSQTPDEYKAKSLRRALLFANAQVAVDLFLLTLILRYTGGVENPMVIFYLFHMAIGALLLKAWHAMLQGAWAVLLFAVLAIGELTGWIAPHWDFLPQLPSSELYTHGEYVFSVLTVMACGVFAMLYFTLHITGRLDEREGQLRSAYDALQRSQASITDLQMRRSRFLQTAAHQLKGPLASIQTLLGLLSDGIVPTELIRGTYGKMAQRCREGTQQVGELLTLARVQQADPRRHPLFITDVARIAEEVCRQFEVHAEDKGIALDFRAQTGEVFDVNVDPGDMRDCVSNLVDNAIKYTNGPGNVRVTVVSRVPLEEIRPSRPAPTGDSKKGASPPDVYADDRAEQFVSVTVADSGIGIEPESLEGAEESAGTGSIFDAFRRGNNVLAAGIPGTGLGLAIVREVVEQAGGRLFVCSQPGKGSTFEVTFPTPNSAGTVPRVRDTRAGITVLKEAPATEFAFVQNVDSLKTPSRQTQLT